MRLYQLTENRDYALAKRLFDQLSTEAQYQIRSWENMNWHTGDLTTSFETNNKVAQEILQVGQPIRDQIRQREGDTILLYRGIDKTASEKTFRADRALYSWTSSEKIARHFAGTKRYTKKLPRPITDQEIQAALERYEKTGFTTFRGKKYKINKEMPQYYDIYDRWNNLVTDGDDLEAEFRDLQDYYDELIQDNETLTGRIVKKEIPVKDIVWVLMGGNANEYIVNGHPE